MQSTLLLVDDERGITDALQRMLRGEPWDNLLLTLNIREGLRQQQLLQHSTTLLRYYRPCSSCHGTAGCRAPEPTRLGRYSFPPHQPGAVAMVRRTRRPGRVIPRRNRV